MNTLSWMLYLAEIVGKLNVFLGFTIGISLVVIIVMSFSGAIMREDGNVVDGKAVHKRALRLLWVPIIAGFLVVFVPTRETFYLIAASELTDKAVVTPMMNDPEIKEIFSLAKKRVLGYLKEETKEKDGEADDKGT